MPSPLPSTFASAAAGNTDSTRRETAGSGEWSRNRLNGATQTFRRPSVATNTSHTRETTQVSSNVSTPTVPAYIPPHLNSNYQSGALRGGSTGDNRYSKDQLLHLYRSQKESKDWGKNVTDHFMADWNPLEESPTTNGGWGKREDFKDSHAGPEVCWDHDGKIEPLALIDMNQEEKELFSTSVNSPLKPPPQNAKDGSAPSSSMGRKSSFSHSQGHMSSFNASSPGSARPGPRRRGTGDSVANTMSPTGNSRFFRDEPNASTPPPSLLRRKTDFKDSKLEEEGNDNADRDVPLDISSPFAALKRSSTNPLGTSTTSPWPTGSSFSPMGSFGNFSLGTIASPPAEKKTSFGSLRGESRFKNLLSKSSTEDFGASSKEKPSILDRLPETDTDNPPQTQADGLKNRPTRSETNPFEESRSGSAALGGQDLSASSAGIDQFGLSFGMPTGPSAIREMISGGQQHVSGHILGNEPMSPTHTNPYQSPHGDRADPDEIATNGSDIHHNHLPGLSELREDSGPSTFGTFPRGTGDITSGDRSQTSSVGGSRSFSGLGGLGGLAPLGTSTGWPPSAATGTPTRERSAFMGAFGDPLFAPMPELQSPSLSALGGGGFFGSHTSLSNAGTSTRPSKLGSLFPPAMQDQMRDNSQSFAGLEGTRAQDPFMVSEKAPGAVQSSQAPSASLGVNQVVNQPAPEAGAQASGQSSGSSSTTQLPPAQQRQMVMPDRMRWIYRDHKGNTQGPWSGLEMHDWFKAGFFTAELQVKKLEDTEYEPLGQLVRRIGNSREPFLVPQIGVPHGPPVPQTPWPASSQGGAVQPPFASSFPSFGTTLTADQQNALERRKQEEQYMMARQKEHLAQQQAMMKQMQFQAPGHSVHPQLQHHSSAHSLQSQPSYGSIASPATFQPSSIQAPIQPPQPLPGFFDSRIGSTTMPGVAPQMPIQEPINTQDQLPAMLDRININRNAQYPFGVPSFGARQAEAGMHPDAVTTMLQDRSHLEQEQEQFNQTQSDSIFDQQAREERLRQFHALRNADEEASARKVEGLPTHPPAPSLDQEPGVHDDISARNMKFQHTQGELSLTQQVQNAATSQRLQMQAQAPTQQESPWAKIDTSMPQPFPPPPSQSPLPAPAAQRKQNIADTLVAGSRSQSQTPAAEAQTASIAPWAAQATDMPKGPSLKEIQEAEARKAAKLEEVAAAARRAIAEQERANQPAPPAPGLPSTANWASTGSPASPTPPGSVWAKSVTGKTPTPTSTAPKKTLAQIQKEEEMRKQRLAAASAQVTATAVAATSGGKRYADLASKVSPTNTAPVGGAWTTVGAGGKAKAPVAPAAPARAVVNTLPAASAVKARPMTAPRSAAAAAATNPSKATEELLKWAKVSLGKGLNSAINVDDFVQQLLLLPPETEIISDSVYANSQTLDGRRFADEFIRRRKLADKGIIESAPSTGGNMFGAGSGDSKGASDGWNEVAKKGSTNAHREDTTAPFKVVSKKKGKR
ncbi:kinesin-like protein [Ophidiomyces ophidiicola]|nr:kinesin-like protein [Ophidiomyces ophidiicola]